MIFKGQALIFGVRDIRPIVNAPGPVRVRMRAGKPATGSVRTANGFEHFILQPADGLRLDCPAWKLGTKIGASCKSHHENCTAPIDPHTTMETRIA